MLRLRSYRRISVENRRFRSTGGQLTKNFRYSSPQKTRLSDLSYGIKIWTDLSSILSQFACLTDRRSRRDRWTDSFLIVIPRLHSMQRGKNQWSSLVIITSNMKPFFCTAYCSKNVCWRSRQFGISAEVSARQFGTGADLTGHFGTNLMVPKCLGSEVSWVGSVLTLM